MPTNRITMRQIRETLRLHLCVQLSFSEVGRSLKISKSAAAKYASLARAANVDWEIAQTLTDQELEARLYKPALPRSSPQLAPDFATAVRISSSGSPARSRPGLWGRVASLLHKPDRLLANNRTTYLFPTRMAQGASMNEPICVK